MISILLSVLLAFLGAYLIARIKPHLAVAVLGSFAGLFIFLAIFFGSHIIFLSLVYSPNPEAETLSVIRYGRLFLTPLRWVPWIIGLGVVISGLGGWAGWARGKSRTA